MGVAVLGVIAAYGVVSPAVASAASLSGSNFEIDGGTGGANLTVDGASPAIDWLNSAGTAMRDNGNGDQVFVRDDRPTGQHDDSFTQGTDINQPNAVQPATITTGSIPNNKSDLTHFGIYKEANGSDPFINVFWTRVQAPSGTTTMDFEFNQSAARSNDISPPNNTDVNTTTIPVRTPGDILITYLLEQGGTHPTLTKRIWEESGANAWGPVHTFSVNDALGAINTTKILAAHSGGLGDLDPLTFGEASIRLSAFASGQSTCTTFGSVYLRSRSSATDTDENKDFIAPEPITISNCGTVHIHKTESTNTGTHSALSGAVFTLYHNVAPLTAPRTSADTATTLTCTTDSSGDCTIANVPKGDYWAVETGTPAHHDTAADQALSITAGDQEVSLSFDDPIQYGHITVIKDAVPNDPQDFTFALDGGSAVTLDDDPVSATPNSHTYTVPVGSHSLVETDIPSGWVNTNISCVTPTGSTASASVPTSTVAINVANGQTVTCTYTDTYTPTLPVLDTTANVSVANTTWTDTATLTGDGTHAVTGSVAFYECGPTSSAQDCTSTANQVGSAVAVSGGSATSAGFTPTAAGNYCFRAVFTSSSPYYTDASHTNSSTECFLKQNADLTVTKTATPSFGRAYTWNVDKIVDGPDHVNVPAGTTHAFPYKVTVTHSATDSTWKVTGQITVHNSNAVAFSGVTVTDAIDNAGVCTVPDGSGVTVPANGTAVLDYTCTYTSQPAPTATNTATATWSKATYFTPGSSASGTAGVDFGSVTPSTTDEFVTVTDTLGGVLSGAQPLDGAVAANPTVYTYSVEQTAPQGSCTTFPNTVSVTTVRNISEGIAPPVPTTVTLDTASASATLCGGLPLGVDATGGGTFDRTYQWLIDKSVDNTLVTVDNGKTGTFNYTVTVTPNGALDSGYALSGTVTVNNPNTWEDITADVTVATDLGGGAACTVADGQDAVIPRGQSVPFDYSCTFTGTPALTGTATATAAWNAVTAATTDASTDAPASVSLEMAPNPANETITVTDDKTDPANPVQLGTWSYGDGAHAFTYALTKTGSPGTAAGPVCVDYTNVATIVETKQSDSQLVTLCHTFTGGGGTPVVNPPQGGGLPFTGDALALLARTALALLGAGLVLLVLSRRRRQA